MNSNIYTNLVWPAIPWLYFRRIFCLHPNWQWFAHAAQLWLSVGSRSQVLNFKIYHFKNWKIQIYFWKFLFYQFFGILSIGLFFDSSAQVLTADEPQLYVLHYETYTFKIDREHKVFDSFSFIWARTILFVHLLCVYGLLLLHKSCSQMNLSCKHYILQNIQLNNW